MSQVSTVYVEGTIFSCFFVVDCFFWTLYPDRPYGTFAKSNSHIRLGKSPEKKCHSYCAILANLFSSCYCLQAVAVASSSWSSFVAFKHSVLQSLLASVTTKAPSTELLPLSPQSTATGYTILKLPAAAIQNGALHRSCMRF